MATNTIELVDVLLEIMNHERGLTPRRQVRVGLALPVGTSREELARELARRRRLARCDARRRDRA